MSETNNTKEEFRKNLIEALRLRNERMATTNEEYFAKLKGYGIDLSEENILEDYDRVRDVQTLDDTYYEKYGKSLDNNQKDKVVNSDVFMLLMDRIILISLKLETRISSVSRLTISSTLT